MTKDDTTQGTSKKDDHKKTDATRQNSSNNPVPNAKQFTSEYQPDPKNVSKGVKEHHARLVIQRELEKTLEEMLNDPMTDAIALTNFIKSMPKHKTIVQAITALLMKDMLNPATPGKDRMKLLETLIKSGYGDKVDITSGGEPLRVIIEPEFIESKEMLHNNKSVKSEESKKTRGNTKSKK